MELIIEECYSSNINELAFIDFDRLFYECIYSLTLTGQLSDLPLLILRRN